MKLLPTAQTEAQLKALRKFLDEGRLTLSEPCNCNGAVRHNNGGNYHEYVELRADVGKWFARFGSTSEYDSAEWEEIKFVKLLNVIQNRAADGYFIC